MRGTNCRYPLACLLATAGLLGPAGSVAWPQPDDKQAELLEKKKAEQEAEKAAREKIAEFNKALSGAKSSSDIASAIRILDVKHAIILERLVRMLNGPGDDVIYTAILDTLVKIDDPRCVPALNASLIKRLQKPRDNGAICITMLKAVGHFGDRSSAQAVTQALDVNENAVAAEACSVAGRVKDPLVIDELIKLLREAEQQDTYLGGGGAAGGGGGALGRGFLATNRRKELRDPAQNALKESTGQNFGSSRDWQSWWSSNRATWKPAETK